MLSEPGTPENAALPGQRLFSGRRRVAARRRVRTRLTFPPHEPCYRLRPISPLCPAPMMRLAALCLTALLLPLIPDAPALAQSPGAKPHIEWEVKNRFRLFRSESDFQRQVASWRNDGVLGSERRLAIESDGRGWARDTVERLCVDRAGRLMEFCERDGTREIYLAPSDHRVGVVLAAAPVDAVNCVWTFEDGSSEPRQAAGSCEEEMRLRVVHGRPTTVTVDVVLPDGTAQRVVTEIQVRDVLIAGLGDFDRRRRRQSRPAGAALRRRLLLPPFPRRRNQRVLPARPRRLQRQPLLRGRGIGPPGRRLGTPERALA